MKYVIIGAGWYGCHLADYLIDHGKSVILVDKTNSIFVGSSFRNQNRLHLGFHYPRSTSTINECKDGYTRFLKKYSSIVHEIPKNIYYISSINSIVDIHTYKTTMNDSKISYDLCDTQLLSRPLRLRNIEDKCFNTTELYIDHRKARNYFRNRLHGHLLTDIPSESFTSIESIAKHVHASADDIIINCTYNQLNPINFHSYELFLSLIYKIENIELFALTLMDGPFFSIYPYDIENKLYTVTSVEHGVVYSSTSLIQQYNLDEATLLEKRSIIEKLLGVYIENWAEYLEYSSYNLSWKTKPNTETDDRSVRIERQQNIINIYGGKITGIFNAEDYISTLLNTTAVI